MTVGLLLCLSADLRQPDNYLYGLWGLGGAIYYAAGVALCFLSYFIFNTTSFNLIIVLASSCATNAVLVVFLFILRLMGCQSA